MSVYGTDRVEQPADLDEVHNLDVAVLEDPVDVPLAPLGEAVVVLPGPVCRQVGVVRGRGIGNGPSNITQNWHSVSMA